MDQERGPALVTTMPGLSPEVASRVNVFLDTIPPLWDAKVCRREGEREGGTRKDEGFVVEGEGKGEAIGRGKEKGTMPGLSPEVASTAEEKEKLLC
jgi:hypothetical protein